MTTLNLEEKSSDLEFAPSLEISLRAPSDWDEFIDENTRCIFHKKTWVEILRRGYGNKCLYIFLREHGKIVIGITGILFDFKIMRLFFSMVPYGGIIGNTSWLNFFLPALEKILREQNVHQIRISQVEEYAFPNLSGYIQKRASQHRLDLKNVTKESLWRNYRKNNRRDINKAKKSGITIREMGPATELEAYYRLYHLTMQRNEALCHYTWDLYQQIHEKFILFGNATILGAYYEGRMIAASLLVISEDRMYLVGNVSDPDYLKFCPNDFLYHEALEKALERGLTYFDFMMSEDADEHLIRFKEKWGARKFPFLIFQKDLNLFRCQLWRWSWSFASTKLGSFFIRLIQRGK